MSTMCIMRIDCGERPPRASSDFVCFTPNLNVIFLFGIFFFLEFILIEFVKRLIFIGL